MEKFLIVNSDGSTYKCEPQLIKKISDTEITKIATNASLAGRIKTSTLLINQSRFASLKHFKSCLPGQEIITALPVHTVVEGKKKVVFSKINQLHFSGSFVQSGIDPTLATIRHYSTTHNSHGCEELYNSNLSWSSHELKKLTGIGMYFIPFAVFPLVDGEQISDMGKDLSRVNWETPKSERGVEQLFKTEQYSGETASLFLGMGIEGQAPTFFPILSNVFADLRVCLGRYYPQMLPVAEFTDTEMFSYMLISFLFSEFNSDLATTTGADGTERNRDTGQKKVELLEKLFCWNKSTLAYSPRITQQDIDEFCKTQVVRKFALDIAKRAIDTFPAR